MSFSVSASSWESDVNVSNNTSVAHVKVTITTSGESYSNYDHYGTIVIDGTSYSHGAYRLPKNTTKTFESVKTITHNNDGTKSINWSYSFPVKTDDTRTGSGSLTLTTIPRATTPVVNPTSVNLGSSVTISMNRATDSFTHTLTYSIGSLSGTIGSNLGTSVTWKPPDGSTQALSPSLATAFPNAQSGTVTITCKTYNGGTLIGTKTCNLTVKTINNSNYQPSINLTINGSNLFKTKYLNKVSGVNVTSTRSGKFGATINSYSISGANTSIANNNLVISPINITMSAASQKVRFTGSVTDSRGYTGSSYQEIDLYRYNTPTLDSNYISVIRCDSAGNEITNGTYAKVNLKYTYQNDGYSNTMSVHKININGTDYTITTTETTSSGVVTGIGTQVVGGGNLGINNHYSWTITCKDEVGSIVSANGVLQTASRIINVRPGGKGIAFGKFAETDNLVDSAWNFKAPKITATSTTLPNLEGTATNANNATNVNVLNTTLASGTNYYPMFATGNSGNQRIRGNANIKIPSSTGTIEFAPTITTGTNSYAIKYPSGLMICVGKDINMGSNTFTSDYWSTNSRSSGERMQATFPATFTTLYTCIINVRDGAGIGWQAINTGTATTSKTQEFKIIRPKSATSSANVYVSYIAIGTWK